MTGKNVRKDEPETALNLGEIREILDLLHEQGISEFELEKNGFRVRIKRGPEGLAIAGAEQHASLAAETPHFGIVHPLQAPPHAAPVAEIPATAPETETHESLHMIKSPIVGTFYSSPGPDAPAFVKVGDVIQQGKVLCIIEAMKLMNEILAEVDGEITKIFVQNGQPVEYGQDLFGVVLTGNK
ncbi:MAG: acetyl-CoA carboxylase biotin carboxyl carrier protein [Acidobacteriota bacterium]|nr:acetyl-CoA carboxylase biotin carboxyl carrier protein [Acidobacteriota bacterium]